MNVPLVDLRAAFAPVKEQVFRDFESILDGMQLFNGSAHGRVRAGVRRLLRCRATGSASRTAPTRCSRRCVACGIGPGDEVIAPAHTFFATIEAIVHAGAGARARRRRARHASRSTRAARARWSPSARARIVPVHLYGQAADMDPLLELAREARPARGRGRAQAHGAKYKGGRSARSATRRAAASTSQKNLGGVGEGGFVRPRATRDRRAGAPAAPPRPRVEVRARDRRLQPAPRRAPGSGAAREAAGPRRGQRAAARARAHYNRLFAGSPSRSPVCRPGNEHVYHVYALRAPRRDELAEHLARARRRHRASTTRTRAISSRR
jgi:dTDP-4-amino-4,6-dideoxygalactose transaminase